MAIPPPAIHIDNTEVTVVQETERSSSSRIRAVFDGGDPREPELVLTAGPHRTSYSMSLSYKTKNDDVLGFSGAATEGQLGDLLELMSVPPHVESLSRVMLSDPPGVASREIWRFALEAKFAVRLSNPAEDALIDASHVFETENDALQKLLAESDAANTEGSR